jgi:hypothetical protein
MCAASNDAAALGLVAWCERFKVEAECTAKFIEQCKRVANMLLKCNRPTSSGQCMGARRSHAMAADLVTVALRKTRARFPKASSLTNAAYTTTTVKIDQSWLLVCTTSTYVLVRRYIVRG